MVRGNTTDGRREKRGEGFELRTSGWGAIRSGKGLFISADDQPRASGQQLDMQHAESLLASALTQMQVLAEMVKLAQAQIADLKSQESTMNSVLKGLKAPAVLVSAPAAIALATPETIQHSAGKNVTLTAGEHIDIGTMENFTVAAGQVVSVFANAGGMRLIAAQGTQQLQAQNGSMELTSAQDMHLLSSNGKVQVDASGSLVLRCGGAEIKLAGGNIELTCPGDVKLNCITLQKSGAGSVGGASKSFDVLSCAAALQRATSAGGAFV